MRISFFAFFGLIGPNIIRHGLNVLLVLLNVLGFVNEEQQLAFATVSAKGDTKKSSQIAA